MWILRAQFNLKPWQWIFYSYWYEETGWYFPLMMMTPLQNENPILQSLQPGKPLLMWFKADIQCVSSVCGPGVRVMLLGLTADQSVHCLSADQLGPGCVCWSCRLPPAPWRASAAARHKHTTIGRLFLKKLTCARWSFHPNVISECIFDTSAGWLNGHKDRFGVTDPS